ncbi:hypothetical protein EON65_28150 [archaeon]|nr:MAG: hypothetical protein EON65_28150 [archaeon]
MQEQDPNTLLEGERVVFEENIFAKLKGWRPYLYNKNTVHLQGTFVLKILRCAILMTSAHTCLCANSAAFHFRVAPPFLEE